jgi:hypothetical protein
MPLLVSSDSLGHHVLWRRKGLADRARRGERGGGLDAYRLRRLHALRPPSGASRRTLHLTRGPGPTPGSHDACDAITLDSPITVPWWSDFSLRLSA